MKSYREISFVIASHFIDKKLFLHVLSDGDVEKNAFYAKHKNRLMSFKLEGFIQRCLSGFEWNNFGVHESLIFMHENIYRS